MSKFVCAECGAHQERNTVRCEVCGRLTVFLIDDPPNVRPIMRVYAYLSTDPNGKQGICAGMIPGVGVTPLVTGNPELAEGPFRKAAEMLAEMTADKTIELYVFDRIGAAPIWRSKPRKAT
jgi:hypothetical protein